MAEENEFTVRDRRRVTPEGETAEKEDTSGRTERTEESGPRPESGRGGRLPPVDFAGFVLGLGEMVLVHLGELPEPQSGKPVQDLEQARHTIDILDLLQTKTKGNLTSDEEQLLKSLLGDLKLRYVRLVR